MLRREEHLDVNYKKDTGSCPSLGSSINSVLFVFLCIRKIQYIDKCLPLVFPHRGGNMVTTYHLYA